METLSFAFGMLVMVAVALIAVVVIGMVKVQQMKKTIDNIEKYLDNTSHEIHDQINKVYSYTDSRFDKMENKLTSNNSKK